MTLAQIEQLLDELQVPTPPAAVAAPAGVHNSTQQTATQSESAEGGQSQVAGQTNGTTQVVVTPAGAPADGGAGAGTGGGGTPAAAVNQTAQGIVQLQVGCIFYCTGTQQTQQAQQSNATVQTVDSAGAGAVNTVSRVVVQVQVGCVAWCYDAVESQTASGSDATVVAVAAPPEVTPPAGTVPVATTPTPATPVGATPVAQASPVPAEGPVASPRSPAARPRGSGGAPVRVPPLSVGGGRPATVLVPVAAPVVASATVPVKASYRSARRAADAPHQPLHVTRHRVSRAAVAAPLTIAGSGPRATAGTSSVESSLELVALLVLAAGGFGVWRWHLVR